MMSSAQPFGGKHPVAFLNEKCPGLYYEFDSTSQNDFIVQVYVGDKLYWANGPSKKLAKVNVAEKVLRDICSENILNPKVENHSDTSDSDSSQDSDDESHVKVVYKRELHVETSSPYLKQNPLKLLNELRCGIEFIYPTNNAGNTFACWSEVDGKKYTGTGCTKKEAKIICAENILKSLYKNAFADPPENLPIAQTEYKKWTVDGTWLYLALECDLAGIQNGSNSGLGRICIVNYDGNVVADIVVKSEDDNLPTITTEKLSTIPDSLPSSFISQKLSFIPDKKEDKKISGYYKADNAITLSAAKRTIVSLLKDHILIGYNVAHQLQLLQMEHPPDKIYDVTFDPTMHKLAIRYNAGTMRLRSLARNILGLKEVSPLRKFYSVIDGAKWIMELYKLSLYVDYCIAVEQSTLTNQPCTMLKRKAPPDFTYTTETASASEKSNKPQVQTVSVPGLFPIQHIPVSQAVHTGSYSQPPVSKQPKQAFSQTVTAATANKLPKKSRFEPR